MKYFNIKNWTFAFKFFIFLIKFFNVFKNKDRKTRQNLFKIVLFYLKKIDKH